MKFFALALTAVTLNLGFSPALAKENAHLTALFDKADWQKDQLIDCKGASKDAVTQVPKEIAGFSRIICTKQGHQFTSKRGWHWHYQAEGLPAFFVSAGSKLALNGKIPDDVGHKGYFTKIEVKRIDYGANFARNYPPALLQNQTVLAANNQGLVANKRGALQIALTLMSGEVMVIHVLDTFKPYDFAYVTTIPGTMGVVLMNDLTKVLAAQAKLTPATKAK